MHKSELLLKLIVTTLLLSSLVYLVKVGIADFLRLEPCAYVDANAKGVRPFDPVELDKARTRLQLAKSWDASNPVVPEYLGQTDFTMAQLLAFSPVLQANFLRAAIVNFDAAIALRPYSAYLWAARMTMGNWLLEVNVKLGIATSSDAKELEEIAISMRRAAILDPWNPSVLQQIIKFGKSRYKQLTVADQVVIDEARNRAKRLNLSI
ncbi:MAG: hypothetical protein WC736_06975 [Gallionella sp.]|jgi:hypothetical protein